MLSIALYQPDIAPNVGAAIRLGRCLGLHLHVIEPCGFVWDEKRIRQAALDYYAPANITRWESWEAFANGTKGRNLALLTTKAARNYTDYTFGPDDILLAGRESAGVPDEVHAAASARLLIPLQAGTRSFNVLTAIAMVSGEALRQTGQFPKG
jgi:tRNA (cytidine/uridine-2'-O-)-methyltransferase